jgi:hypothetical protein
MVFFSLERRDKGESVVKNPHLNYLFNAFLLLPHILHAQFNGPGVGV